MLFCCRKKEWTVVFSGAAVCVVRESKRVFVSHIDSKCWFSCVLFGSSGSVQCVDLVWIVDLGLVARLAVQNVICLDL